ncbi:MAG: protein phosphatase CheZ [Betaproteobacteria bacterium]|nr:protein phosphatase CheZ [Betaproteobacteria bacterium]
MSKGARFDKGADSADLQRLFDSLAGGTTALAKGREPGGAADDSDTVALQALFDQVAGAGARPPLRAVSGAIGPRAGAQSDVADSDDLQALFDAVSCEYGEFAACDDAAPAGAGGEAQSRVSDPGYEAVINRIGHMTRQLHDTLRELGYDRKLEESARAIPDACERLSYIAQMTEQAASRVLNAVDEAKPLQDATRDAALALGERWDGLFQANLSVQDFRTLAADTRRFLDQTVGHASISGALLTDIMMAQDYQDLTGQVIKRVVEVVQRTETELLQLLIEAMPPQRRPDGVGGLLNGPVINAAGRSDVVANQSQVDELLESLGF